MVVSIGYGLSSIMLFAGMGLAQAEPAKRPETPVYVVYRIESAFAAVSEMPPPSILSPPLAVKGDLPPGCAGPFKPVVQAECLDAAYEPGTDPRTVVEIRTGSTSILRRLHDLRSATIAHRQEAPRERID
jgi:hypothetical protein